MRHGFSLKRITANAALAVAGIVIALLLMEAILRIAGISYTKFSVMDEARGWALRPDTEGWYRGEAVTYVRINSHGMRDFEREMKKPAGVYRIAVLGDSFTEGLHVEQDETFCAVMEKEFSKRGCLPGDKVEVLNFGVSGYGTIQEYITLREKVWEFSPDMVILAFDTVNDVRDNSKRLTGVKWRPFVKISGDKVELDMSFRDLQGYKKRNGFLYSFYYDAVSVSRVMQALQQAKHAWESWRTMSELRARGGHDESSTNYLSYSKPVDEDWERAWEVTEKVILLARDEAVAHGADFILVVQGVGIQIHPDKSIRQKYMEELGLERLDYPDRRLMSLGEREGFKVISLTAGMRDYAESRSVYLHYLADDSKIWGHWNSEGHKLAGKLLTQKICEWREERDFAALN